MGLQLEFNWYIVLKDNNLTSAEQHNDLDDREISMHHSYYFVKQDYRIYPMDTPLPLIYNGKCLALAMIKRLEWGRSETHLIVEPVLIFEEGDAVALYYESSFQEYKAQQQMIDDGGKIDVRSIVNPKERVRV